jgi:CHASE2 domain-containing sensor protein
MALAGGAGARFRDSLGRWSRPVGLCLLFVLLLLIFRLLEAKPSVTWLETRAYAIVQWQMAQFSSAKDVVVVDIARLRPDNGVTSRRALLDLITRLEAAGARAIGIDIDFSPENNVFVTPHDPAFFEECRRSRPFVFLGVARTAGSGREAWLGRREFAQLAAGIVIPETSGTVNEGGAPGPYPLGIPNLGAKGSGDDLTHLPSMAVALASIVRPRIEHELLTPGYISEPVVERTVLKDVAVPEFAVNYGFIPQLRTKAIVTRWDDNGRLVDPIDRGLVNGRLVLIGDVGGSSESDVFGTRGSVAKASGVLIHASAAMTLIQAPLRLPKEWFRAALQACLMVWIAGAFGKREKPTKTDLLGRLRWWAWWGLTVAIPATVLIFVWQGILWFDWLPVPIVAVLHAFLEKTEEASVGESAPSAHHERT